MGWQSEAYECCLSRVVLLNQQRQADAVDSLRLTRQRTLSIERTMAPFTFKYNRCLLVALSRCISGHAAIVAMVSDALLPFGKTVGLGSRGIVGLKILAHWQARGPCANP